jgi:hypothetical protein
VAKKTRTLTKNKNREQERGCNVDENICSRLLCCREHTWQGTAGKCLKYIYYAVFRKRADVTFTMRI